MPRPHATVCLTFDFDAISVWIGPRGATSPSAISRGEYAVVGVARILKLLRGAGIRATFFVPGHTVETYPASIEAILADGHEVGHHGYLHENPAALGTREREREVLVRGLEALRAAGVEPTGYRSPAWDNSPNTVELLVEHGFRYESSLMADDFIPYRCRVGDEAPADAPYRFGETVDLVELPVSWVLDDFPHFEFVSSGGSLYPGLSSGSKVQEIWEEEFRFMHREVPGGVFTLTMHPEIVGRGHRMLMLERLVAFFASHEGVSFTTCGDAADAWRNDPAAP